MTATWVAGPEVFAVDHGPPLADCRRHGQLLQGLNIMCLACYSAPIV